MTKVRELLEQLENEDMDRELVIIHDGKMYEVGDEFFALDGENLFALIVGAEKCKCHFKARKMVL